jgi:peroxiredoxin
MRIIFNAVIALPALLCASGWAAEPAKTEAKSPETVRATFSLRDTAGTAHTVKEWKEKKAVVLLFIAVECPVSNFYSPDFSRIAKDYGHRGVAVYGVHSDPDVSAADGAKHAKEYGLDFPVLLDPKQKLAEAVGARKTPEAFVLSPDGKVIYHGRIDDRYSLDGKRRDEPTRCDLTAAIDAVLAGKTPEVIETEPYGCPLPKR